MLRLVEDDTPVAVRDRVEVRWLTTDGTQIVGHIHPAHCERVREARMARDAEEDAARGWLPPAA